MLRVWARGTRGPAAWTLAVLILASASGLGGRAGLALASAYILFSAGYCVVNFWTCREVHCALTGPGFALTGALGVAAATVGRSTIAWYPVDLEVAVFLAVLILGFAFEAGYARRTRVWERS